MKSFSKLKFLLLFVAFCAFSVLEVNAYSRYSPSVREIKSCIAQKEKAFGGKPLVSGELNLEEYKSYVAEIDGLIGCVNQGLKIPNLSWHVRRDWLIKKSEYYQMRQVFAQYACYAANVGQTSKLTEATEKAVENNNKKVALRNVNLLQAITLRSKECIDRGTRFKHIDPEFKDGFRTISGQIDELIEKVEELRSVVKKMPK